MKKIMIDNRNAKIIAFALVAVLLLIGTVGMASAAMGSTTFGGSGGLVAYYPFNGDAKDKSGNGNDGTIHGATWVDNGGCGKALSFDGGGDYVEISDSDSLDFEPNDSFTIELWMKLAGSSTEDYLLSKHSTTDCIQIYKTTTNKIEYFLRDHSSNLLIDASTNALADDTWHHIAIVRERGANVSLYVDGGFDKSKKDTMTNYINNVASLIIGDSNVPGTWTVDGIIDEVRIYNYAKTQSQIQEDMRKCTPSTPTAAAGPTPTTPTTPPANCIYFNTGAWTNISSVFINGTEIYGGTNNKYSGTAYMYLWLSFDSLQANLSLRPCPDDIDPQTGEPNWGDRAGLAIEEISSTELRSRLTVDFVPYELRAGLKGPYIYRIVVTAPDHGYHSSYIFSFDTPPNYAIGWGNVDAYDWLARVRVCNLG